jgi:hypothetical protein
LVRRALIAVLVMLAVQGCGDDRGVVRLDLCPGRNATEADLESLRRAASWELTVWGVRGDEVTWHELFTADGAVATLGLEATVPPDELVRLMVEGWGQEAGGSRLVAVASSGLLQVQAGVWVCLCTAPPERYETLCPARDCTVNRESGTCWQ